MEEKLVEGKFNSGRGSRIALTILANIFYFFIAIYFASVGQLYGTIIFIICAIVVDIIMGIINPKYNTWDEATFYMTETRVVCMTNNQKYSFDIDINDVLDINTTKNIVSFITENKTYTVLFITNAAEVSHIYDDVKNGKYKKPRIKNEQKTIAGTQNNLDAIDELRRYKQLLDEGIIDQDEFNQKKRQLLNL